MEWESCCPRSHFGPGVVKPETDCSHGSLDIVHAEIDIVFGVAAVVVTISGRAAPRNASDALPNLTFRSSTPPPYALMSRG